MPKYFTTGGSNMTTVFADTALAALEQLNPAIAGNQRVAGEIDAEVALVLNTARVPRHGAERRREQRHAYPYAVYLTPLERDGRTRAGQTFPVLGKHLSAHGFDFYCQSPLPFRRAILTFERGGGERSAFLIDLTWCRFGRHGWYDNGGKFLARVDVPAECVTLPSLFDR